MGFGPEHAQFAAKSGAPQGVEVRESGRGPARYPSAVATRKHF